MADDEESRTAAVKERLAAVRFRIAEAGGDPAALTIVAVSKGQSAWAPAAALQAGLTEIGENYAAELLEKAAAVGDGVHWHFLGAVQRNKVARLAPVVSVWQSVARRDEALAIARRQEAPSIFVEVDVSAAAGRGGCPPAEVPALVDAAREAGCTVRGLMTVAPLVDVSSRKSQSAVTSDAFARVARLASSLGIAELSMGMSHDLELAVSAGSTMVRLGTALFGERVSR